MNSIRLKLDRTALGNLALRSDGVRNLVEEEGSRRAYMLGAEVGDENVATNMGGDSRARYTIRRLEALQREAKDGALSRALHG